MGILWHSMGWERGWNSLPLDRQGEAHTVVGHVEDGVIFLQENISQDPEGLPVLRGQVGDLDAQGAVAIALQEGTEGGQRLQKGTGGAWLLPSSWNCQHGSHTDHTWVSHGSYMDNVWITYGSHMDHTWITHRSYMDYTRIPAWISMDHTEITYRSHVEHTWITHGSRWIPAWIPRGSHTDHTWIPRGSHTDPTQIPHGSQHESHMDSTLIPA